MWVDRSGEPIKHYFILHNGFLSVYKRRHKMEKGRDIEDMELSKPHRKEAGISNANFQVVIYADEEEIQKRIRTKKKTLYPFRLTAKKGETRAFDWLIYAKEMKARLDWAYCFAAHAQEDTARFESFAPQR